MTLSPSDGALLEALRSLRWPARRRTPAGLPGEHASRATGGAAEFTEYRGYRQGDAPARIDWKLLARTDRVFVRLAQARTTLPTTFLVDASASLAFPEGTREKWHHARQVTLGLAAAAHRGGDAVGITVATAAGPRALPARTRRGTVEDLARLLHGIEPAGTPPLAPLLTVSGGAQRLVVVSDMLGDTGDLLRRAGPLAAGGRELYAIHLVHALEADPPHAAVLAVDPEQPGLRRPLTRDTRRAYLATFEEWRRETARAWREAGATYVEVVTTEPVGHAVRRIVAPGMAGARP